jgi:hypothetical protein
MTRAHCDMTPKKQDAAPIGSIAKVHLDKLLGDHSEDVCGPEERVEQEEKEVPVVEVTHCVVHPRAEVIHAQYTLSTDRAVVAAWRLDAATVLAVAIRDRWSYVESISDGVNFPTIDKRGCLT